MPILSTTESEEGVSNDAIPEPKLDECLARFAPDYQKRLRSLYHQWLKGTASKLATQELQKAGIVLKDPQGEESDIISGGLDGVGAWISRTYPGVVISKSSLSCYIRGKKLPNGCLEPMPPPANNRDHLKSRIAPWVERYCVNNPHAGQQRLTAAERKQEADARKAEIETEQLSRSLDEKWILKADAASTVTGAVMNLHSVWKKHLDQLERRLDQTKFMPEQWKMIQNARIETVKAIEASCEAYGAS